MRVESGFRAAFVVTCLTLLAGAIGFRAFALAVNAWLLKEPAPLRAPLSTIPTTLGQWRAVGPDTLLNDAMVEALGTKFYLNRNYAIDGDPAKGFLQLHIAFYTGLIDRVPHIPERCFVAGGLVQRAPPQQRPLAIDRSGWSEEAGPVNLATGERYPMATVRDPITLEEHDVHLPIGETAFTVIEFQDPAHPEMRLLGGYLFIANGRLTPSAGGVRGLSYSLSERFAYFAKVQFTGQYRGGDGSGAQYEALVADLLRELLPYLMQRLPDWPEYEARTRIRGTNS
ncbi:MAG: exosortase-associated EpsI family protein [Phycisphaeraceae bacterium]|nr:exosortase-associated EpsI family protein [Phycisphaeraceae bacterium]